MKTSDLEKAKQSPQSPHISGFASMRISLQVIEKVGGAGRDRTDA